MLSETNKRDLKVADLVKRFENTKKPPEENKPKLTRSIHRSSSSVVRFRAIRDSYVEKVAKGRYATWNISRNSNATISECSEDGSIQSTVQSESNIKITDQHQLKDDVSNKNAMNEKIDHEKNTSSENEIDCSVLLYDERAEQQLYNFQDDVNGNTSYDMKEKNIVEIVTNDEDSEMKINDEELELNNIVPDDEELDLLNIRIKEMIVSGDNSPRFSYEYNFPDNNKIIPKLVETICDEEPSTNQLNIETEHAGTCKRCNRICSGCNNIDTLPEDSSKLMEELQFLNNDCLFDNFENKLEGKLENSSIEDNFSEKSLDIDCPLSDTQSIESISDLVDHPGKSRNRKYNPYENVLTRDEANKLLWSHENNAPAKNYNRSNIEAYRAKQQREAMLYENICLLNDLDSHNNNSTEADEERSSVNVSATTNTFGEGIFMFHIATSYLEVRSPKVKCNGHFFNEVVHLVKIPVVVAKFIKKPYYHGENIGKREMASSEQVAAADMIENESMECNGLDDDVFETGQSIFYSNTSVDTIESDFESRGTHDSYHSMDETSSANVIVEESTVLRVDHVYCNNQLRIKRNVILKESTTEKPKKHSSQREHIIGELVKTERDNLLRLEVIRDKYMIEFLQFKEHPQIVGKFKYVFLNIDKIYVKACKFYQKIEECGYNYELLAGVILESRDMFEEYALFCINKVIADRYIQSDLCSLMSVIQTKVNDQQGLSSHLIATVNRMTKIRLLLLSLDKDLEKTYEGSAQLKKAIHMVARIILESNDLIAACSIIRCPFDIRKQGKVICRDVFDVECGKTKWMDVELFLFEKVLIFAQKTTKCAEQYFYKEAIFLNELMINVNGKFIKVYDFERNKKAQNQNQFTYILTSKNKAIDRKWRKYLEDQLWMQMEVSKKNAAIQF